MYKPARKCRENLKDVRDLEAMSDSAGEGTPITVTESAARRIASLMREEEQPVMLRVSVSGGGCSGFQYGFAFDDTRNEDDIVVERDGAVVVVDSVSLTFLEGSEIDYVTDLIGSSFQVKNPNATASCGCGTSFSV